MYKFFRRYINTNIVILTEKLAFYNDRLIITTNKLNITNTVIHNNKYEFELMYDIPLKNINISSTKINHVNKILLLKHSQDFATKMRNIDKSYGEHTVLFIKSIVDNYFELQKEIKQLERQIQLLNDKLEFFNRYKELSDNVFRFIIAKCNEYYEQLLLNGGTVHLGYNIGYMRVDIKNVANRINWDESKKQRERLIAEGKEPFSKENYEKALKAGEPYNGVFWYVMYENETQPYINWYSNTLKLPNRDGYSFEPRRFNLTDSKNSELVKKHTPEEIMKLDIGIVNKLHMLTVSNKMQFLKYIGNDIQTCPS